MSKDASNKPHNSAETEQLLQRLEQAGLKPLIDNVAKAIRLHEGINAAKEALNAALDEQQISDGERAALYTHIRATSPRRPSTRVTEAAPAVELRFQNPDRSTDIQATLMYAFRKGLRPEIEALQNAAKAALSLKQVSLSQSQIMDTAQAKVSAGLRKLNIYELNIHALCEYIRGNPDVDLIALVRRPKVMEEGGRTIDNKAHIDTTGTMRFYGNFDKAYEYIESRGAGHLIDNLKQAAAIPRNENGVDGAQAAASRGLRTIGIHDVDITEICNHARKSAVQPIAGNKFATSQLGSSPVVSGGDRARR